MINKNIDKTSRNTELKELPKLRFKTSWDDGSIHDLLIADLLKEFGISSTFYIVVDWVGTDGYLTWKQIKQIDEDPLFEIGSHTMSHPMDLKLLYEEELFYEVQNSKDLLETVLGHEITSFCYPRGRHNDTVRQRVSKSGYLEARTTIVGSTEPPKNSFETNTTVHVYDGRPEYKHSDWTKFGIEQLDKALQEPNTSLFHLWGHSHEVVRYEELEHLRAFLQIVTERCVPVRKE